MKKVLSALIALAMLSVGAAAAPGDATLMREGMDGFSDSINSMAYLDGTLYLMSYGAIYTCRDGEARVEKHEVEFPVAEEENGYTEPILLFAEEGELKLLTVENESWEEDGEWYTDVSGAKLYRVLPGEEGFSFEEAASLDWDEMLEESDSYTYTRQMRAPFAEGGILYFTSYGSASIQLMGYDLTEGEMALEEDMPDLQGAYRYRDGLLLLLNVGYKDEAYKIELLAYDPASGESEPLCELPATDRNIPGHLCYDGETDTLYFVMAGELWKMEGMNPETLQSISAIMLDAWSNFAPVLTDDHCFVACDYQTVFRRGTDPNARASTRLVVRYAYQQAVENAGFTFGNAHGDVEIILANQSEDILEAMMNRSTAVDIYCLSASSAEYSALYERGYLQEMTDSEALFQFAENSYPAFHHALFRQGELVAIPLSVSVDSMSLSQAALKRLGIEEASVPASWDELFDFLEALPEKMVAHPKMMALDPFTTQENFRYILFNFLLNAYLTDQLSGGEAIALDTELFRHLAGRLEAMDFEALGLPEEQTETSFSYEDGDLLMQTYSSVSQYLYSWNTDIPLLLALEEGENAVAVADLMVLVVNPYSENRETAVAFAEEVVRQIDAATRIQLQPAYDEPVENSYYASNLENYDENIQDLERQLEKADADEAEDLEETLQNMRDNRRDFMETERWEIAPESIARYHEYAQSFVLARYMGMRDSEFSTLQLQYLSGAITLDEFVREVDGKLRMMMLENS